MVILSSWYNSSNCLAFDCRTNEKLQTAHISTPEKKEESVVPGSREKENKSGRFRKKVMALRPLRESERVMCCRNAVTQSTHYLGTRRLNSGGKGTRRMSAVESHVQRATSVSCSPL
ncbi:hypothetical protein CEXT_133851 [Caerostris extrusa]|uniref:Uncharacterized protein n=1 Tax=Caerostris extrusa TaxID=172846 RepID=A0AAV4V6R5_CAEEX|nr:hypothetical protein CEXT_133851 [Caerostris extrusa]